MTEGAEFGLVGYDEHRSFVVIKVRRRC